MFAYLEIPVISAAVALVVGGLTIRAWLAKAKLEGMVEVMNAVVEEISPHYNSVDPFPDDLGRAFIEMRSDISGAWFYMGRIKAFSRHANIVAAKMAEACVEEGRRKAIRELSR